MQQDNYFSMAFIQQMLYFQYMRQLEKTKFQISHLKQALSVHHKKHRRCDKELVKDFHCLNCGKIYASEVALRLHIKLKHLKSIQNKVKKEESIPQISEQDATLE